LIRRSWRQNCQDKRRDGFEVAERLGADNTNIEARFRCDGSGLEGLKPSRLR
jgi:hypothetical protein